MRYEEHKEMLELEALGVLAPEDSRALREHAGVCAECRQALGELQDATSLLAYLAPEAEPSPEVRARVLERLATTKQDGRPADGGASKSPAPAPAPVVLPFRPRSQSLKWGALAASLALVGVTTLLLVVWRDRERMAAEFAREREARELLAAPESRVAVLAGTEAAPRARAKLTYDQGTGRAMFSATGLPRAPAGKAYQLWFITADGRPLAGGVFHADASGHAELRDQVPAEGRSAPVFAVTLEPEGGVSSPTGAKYLLSGAT